MFKKIFSKKINNVTLAAALVAGSSLASRALGVFRDRVLAGEFGLGDQLDVYYASFRVPDFIFNLLILGALSAGFIPVFSQLLDRLGNKTTKLIAGEEAGQEWKLANNVLNILALCMVAVSLVGIFLAPQIVDLISPGFPPEKRALTASLTRIMFLSPIFLSISSVLGGVLQSYQYFFVYSLSPIMYNIGIIAGALWLSPRWGVYGLAWGVVVGAFLHMAVQWPAVLKLGWRWQPIFNFRDKYFRKIMALMVPRTMSLAIGQFSLLAITIIASGLPSGSVSVFNYANNLQYFPVGIFGISFAIAVFPTLSKFADNNVRLIENFSSVFRQILFFIIPSSILLFVLRAQVIRILFGTGRFDWNATVLTLETLSWFLISLFAQATIPLLTRVFYAKEDSKTPFMIGILSEAINISFALYLSRKFGVVGLSLAFSISSIFNFSILWLALRSKLGSLDGVKIAVSSSKFLLAGGVAGGVAQLVKTQMAVWVDMNKFLGITTQGAVAGLAGLAVYFLACWILKSEEFLGFIDSCRRRWIGRRLRIEDQGEARGI